jgi:hypothetical protein
VYTFSLGKPIFEKSVHFFTRKPTSKKKKTLMFTVRDWTSSITQGHSTTLFQFVSSPLPISVHFWTFQNFKELSNLQKDSSSYFKNDIPKYQQQQQQQRQQQQQQQQQPLNSPKKHTPNVVQSNIFKRITFRPKNILETNHHKIKRE